MSKTKDRLLEQARKLNQRIEADRRKVKAIQRKISVEERKKRTRELIQIGGIVEIAGLRTLDKGVLLGLLMKSREVLKDELTVKELKRIGDAELRARAQKRHEK